MIALATTIAVAADPAGHAQTGPIGSQPVIPGPSTGPAAAPIEADDAVMRQDAAQIECVTKVIRHEAANQPIEGQIAVAEVIRNRMKDGRFPTTACGVVKQHGQFFDVDAYDPPRGDTRWATALRVATMTMSGEDTDKAQGALFFHTRGARMAGRLRTARIADHIFYR